MNLNFAIVYKFEINFFRIKKSSFKKIQKKAFVFNFIIQMKRNRPWSSHAVISFLRQERQQEPIFELIRIRKSIIQ